MHNFLLYIPNKQKSFSHLTGIFRARFLWFCLVCIYRRLMVQFTRADVYFYLRVTQHKPKKKKKRRYNIKRLAIDNHTPAKKEKCLGWVSLSARIKAANFDIGYFMNAQKNGEKWKRIFTIRWSCPCIPIDIVRDLGNLWWPSWNILALKMCCYKEIYGRT